jgi:hypothetical protein
LRLTVLATLIALLLQLQYGVTNAQYLSYKQSLWGKFEYTADGIEFKQFGDGWPNLLQHVQSDTVAHRLLKQSRNLSYAAQIFGGAGAFMLGYNVQLEADDRETSNGVWIGGGVLVLSSIICLIAHKVQLDRGFLKFNKNLRGQSDKLGDNRYPTIFLTPRSAGLTYNF